MSEKRFKSLKEVDEYLEKQIQNEKRFWLVSLEYDGEQRFVRDNNLIGEKSLSNQEVVDLLNEQQATIKDLNFVINFQEKEIDSLKALLKEKEALTEENEQLRKELNDCEKFRYQVFKRIGVER